MKHTSNGQASPDIASEGVFRPMAVRILEEKRGNRGLYASNCLLDDRILASGGSYGKYQLKVANRVYGSFGNAGTALGIAYI
jgi:hypothetical protein